MKIALHHKRMISLVSRKLYIYIADFKMQVINHYEVLTSD